jgi:hypothetical protein
VLLRESVFGLDADFREDALVTRINADLANNIGNLVSRTLSMQQKYFGGAVQALGERRPEDEALAAAYAEASREMDTQVRDLMLSRALEAILRAADHANKYIVETAPFTLAKSEATKPRVGAILHNLLEALRATAQLTAPFLPDTAARIVDLLGLPADALRLPGPAWGTAFAVRAHRSEAGAALPAHRGLTPMGTTGGDGGVSARPKALDLTPPAVRVPLIDSHCHLDQDAFAPDRTAVIARARAAGVGRMITVGAGGPLASNHAAIAIAETDPDIFAAVAVHPHDASDITDDTWDELRRLWAHPKVVAVGETGLDYYYEHSPAEVQQRHLRRFVREAGRAGCRS